jgi:drug/metabolite transporter (DMT)-like permease
MRPSGGYPIWLVAALPPLFWAGNFVLARALHADIPPIALSFWRWAMALLVLLPFAWPGLRRQWGLLRCHWPLLSLLALLGVSNYNTFAYLGLQDTSATNAVLLSSATPVLIVALSFLLLRQAVSPSQCLGILLSLTGVVVIATEGRPQLLADMTLNRGDIWILAAGLDWALYSVCLRWRPTELEPLTFLAAIMGIGLIPLTGLYAWDLAQGNRFVISPTNLAAIGYVAVFPSVLAYIFWNRAIQEMGANRTGQYIHLMPAFGALLATLLLGERLLWFHAAGAGLIAIGILLATLRRSPRKLFLSR